MEIKILSCCITCLPKSKVDTTALFTGTVDLKGQLVDLLFWNDH